MDRFYRTDVSSILRQIKSDEKQLKLKRRWLMGLSTSKSNKKESTSPKFLKHKPLPESLLREDDIFHETVKTHVEEAFGACNSERRNHVFQDSVESFDTLNALRDLISCLDALTTNGLYLVSMILTGGAVRFEKTRTKMKKIIREYIPKYFRSKSQEPRQREIITQLSQVLNDPQNFQENGVNFMTPSHSWKYAATKVLDGLGELPTYTLLAMYRKLRCINQVPQLEQKRTGRSRKFLIYHIRENAGNMLMGLGKGDELQKPLAKALAVAGLSQKLTVGYQNSSTTEFYQFSPEIKNLQDEILKAFWLLETNIRFPELKKLKLLLDPDANVPTNGLRSAIKKMLIEYLFECADMGTIPKSLLDALAVINRDCRSLSRRFSKEEIEEEVECILSVSAVTKQIIWDLLPDHELDQEFADAYMEEIEESDSGDDDYDNQDGQIATRNLESCMSHCADSDCCIESTAESVLRLPGSMPNQGFERVSSPTVNLPSGVSNICSVEDDKAKQKIKEDPEKPSIDSIFNSSNHPCKDIPNKQSTYGNQYLSIQEACDETSIVAYNLIGRLLEKLAQERDKDLNLNSRLYLRGNSSIREDDEVAEEQILREKDVGGSFIVKIVEQLMPSFSESGMERLKELIRT